MKRFLKTGILLVSLSALASSPDPALYQYWFDNDEPSKEKNTYVYGAQSNPLTIDASSLTEGGHAVNYRMADKDKKWGGIMTRYFVVPPATPQRDPKEATEPVLIQYWFDNDEASRVRNTRAYDGQSNSLEVDASGLSEGGHALKYRMANKYNQWGSVIMRYFTIPSVPDKSSSKAVAYRIWVNNDIVGSGSVPSNADFTITTDMPDNPEFGEVSSRKFIYRTGEKSIVMDAVGKFVTAFQMLSESNEWGMPIIGEYDHSVSTKLTVDSVPVPYDYTFKKPDNNNFKAYRFICGNISALYLKASQSCSLALYSIDTSSASNLSLLKSFTLKKGETAKYEDSKINNKELIAIIYDTENDVMNQDDDIFLRVMYENNKLPKPEIMFDPQTWEVTMTCADQRAMIYYTLDGNRPTHDSQKYDKNKPIILDRFTTIQYTGYRSVWGPRRF